MNTVIVNIFMILALLLGSPKISSDLTNAIKSGNAQKVATFFGKSVDLSLPGNEGVYSKTQAQLILKNFFTKNKPSAFKIVHSGDSKNNSHYSIGNLSTSAGLYRVYLLYKESGGQTTLLELKIESDE